mmetsp:Transcript_37850/g.46233  ORF Transcript_37850/g.46233 Transcript_37850/m.46233 type:complete len:214 (-) Transcript_37850:535-1176(-)
MRFTTVAINALLALSSLHWRTQGFSFGTTTYKITSKYTQHASREEIYNRATLTSFATNADEDKPSVSTVVTPQSPVKDKDDINDEIEKVKNSMGFRNDGNYWFMKTILPSVFKDGQRVKNGIPTDLDPSLKVSDEIVAERRSAAAERLINIDEDESTRRSEFGKTVLFTALFYAAFISIVVDEGDVFGHLVRLSLFPLFATGYGFYESGKQSL